MLKTIQPLIDRVRTDVCWMKAPGEPPKSVKSPLTDSRIQKHLTTDIAFGCCPIKAGESTTRVAVFDIDDHAKTLAPAVMLESLNKICGALDWEGYSPQCFRSRGGYGIHVALIWDAPQDAYSVREFMRGILTKAGLKSGTKGIASSEVEIFPKQDSVALDGFGSMFILPLAGESVPLEPMMGYEPMERDYPVIWECSPNVPVVAKPERTESLTVKASGDLLRLQSALAAIPNSATDELSYDDWRNMVFAIHHATGGSDEGLALAHEFSAKSGKYDAAFLDNNVWPYITDKEGAITERTVLALAAKSGWTEDVTDAFEVVANVTPEAPAARRKRGIPEAKHLCTDQANASRIARVYNARLMVATDRWFAWCGTHWTQDDSHVYQCALSLSKIIHKEADEWLAKNEKLAADDPIAGKNGKIAEALVKWAKRSEMRGTIDAALYLAKKMLTVPENLLDSDPWALNCRNGTVDLRTGTLREHDPADYITKLAPLDYDPQAVAPTWDWVLARVTLEVEYEKRPVVEFLKRWFGYCATASTREHKFVVHYGTGRNGKSTILDLMADCLGNYAATAAPGLLIARKQEAHPTEIADLFGRRMVTAHETGDGGILREDFIKQATGSDKIKARYMRADFFEFNPTHKLQLLTNHKPVIKGQDAGIWGRVLLVPYLARFGSPDEVLSGIANYERDTAIVEKLNAEREGVLAWIVQGAVEWYRDGLNPPDSVLAASRKYQSEQDRMLQFVSEMCTVGDGQEVPLSGDFNGLFPAYQRWCKEGGYLPLGKLRMVDEISRIVPGLRKVPKKVNDGGAKRRDVVMLVGVGLLE